MSLFSYETRRTEVPDQPFLSHSLFHILLSCPFLFLSFFMVNKPYLFNLSSYESCSRLFIILTIFFWSPFTSAYLLWGEVSSTAHNILEEAAPQFYIMALPYSPYYLHLIPHAFLHLLCFFDHSERLKGPSPTGEPIQTKLTKPKMQWHWTWCSKHNLSELQGLRTNVDQFCVQTHTETNVKGFAYLQFLRLILTPLCTLYVEKMQV